jgi:hypothetical protein
MLGADVQDAEKAKQRQFSKLESGRCFLKSILLEFAKIL